uniref:ABC transporter domain-containing protein n=1 Tax=Haptolina brevifila TaxID=156173 RepID=A0A7S2DW74_9EUKA|mmetsp:Transcript_44088/g.88156  ORF Transcript_44088/g.88156 Transcript_44088/m.88156 type:complete len:335 (+) Transcript_44088:165-1169(+)
MPGGVPVRAGDTPAAALVRASCELSRGQASVKVNNLQLSPAIYALSGPNGSGKSSLLSVLTSCARSGDLQPSIRLSGACSIAIAVEAPSDIVEVHQRPYCPLQCAPIRWLADGLDGDHSELAARAANLATQLRFTGRRTGVTKEAQAEAEAEAEAAMAKELLTEADDYCGGLSGGQRAKLELIRAVFLRPACPPLLLLDEPFAALDAPSRANIMRKLKTFCRDSVVLVVYHPESEVEEEEKASKPLAAASDTASEPPSDTESDIESDAALDTAFATESDSESDSASDAAGVAAGGQNDVVGTRAAVCGAGEGVFFDAVLEVRDGMLASPRSCVP